MQLEIFGLELIARKAAANLRPIDSPSGRGGWYPIIREPNTGAWQQNAEITGSTALSYFAVFACVTLIAADIAKLALRLMRQDDEGVWNETTNPAYSPVLRKPNRYQTTQKFIEQWITSKLVHGNTYVLKERDNRGLVKALYVLDPTKVCPLVAADGAVYYELRRNDLAGLDAGATANGVTVPASEIIHDLMIALFHPLVGVTPLYACGLSALQGITIQTTSSKFFAGGANPGGVLTAPGAIGDDTAKRLKEYWDTNFTGANIGKVAVLGDGLKYEAMTVNAADAQLIEQLRWTAETICACFHVPAFMIGVGPPPPFSSVEPMQQQYYSQCIQSLITSCESSLDEGLGIGGTQYGTEFDIDDLIYMDTSTKTKAAADAIGAGAMSPNEARNKYFGLGSVKGGNTPYMQQQNYSLAALDERDKNSPLVVQPAPAPAALPAPATTPAADEPAAETKATPWAAVALALLRKDWGEISDVV